MRAGGASSGATEMCAKRIGERDRPATGSARGGQRACSPHLRRGAGRFRKHLELCLCGARESAPRGVRFSRLVALPSRRFLKRKWRAIAVHRGSAQGLFGACTRATPPGRTASRASGPVRRRRPPFPRSAGRDADPRSKSGTGEDTPGLGSGEKAAVLPRSAAFRSTRFAPRVRPLAGPGQAADTTGDP